MRSFQDDYNTQVTQKYGLLKLGPRVQRISHAEWRAQKAEAGADAAGRFRRSRRKSVGTTGERRGGLCAATGESRRRIRRCF